MTAGRTPLLRGRSRERERLDEELDRVRGGESAVLVLRGEAGIGKTALMRYGASRAADCRVVEIAGVESEMALPYAALHQLCGSMLDEAAALPEPQLRALRVAFGLADGSGAPDRFVVGLGVLSLLADRSAAGPLVCLVDDAQWLDEPSAQVLGFVGRRLLAESVFLLIAVREDTDERFLVDLPTLHVRGLFGDDARALLETVIPGNLDEDVRDRIVAETRGNPLGLLELPKGLSRAELAGGFAHSHAGAVIDQLNDHYLRLVRSLPEPTRKLMLLAAADPTGDAALLWRAAGILGLSHDAAVPVEAEQLLEIGSRVRFRHPLVRSASYASGSPEARSEVHLALASATDVTVDPDRRVWHRAAAATRPDEEVASELVRLADRAESRGGLAAAAAFLQRSVALTARPELRADRALAAAHANLHAGAFEPALGLLAEAEAAASEDLQLARVQQLKAAINRATYSGSAAPVLLLQAAHRLEPLDAELASETYLDAWGAALVAGRLAEPGGGLLEVSAAARSARGATRGPGHADLLLDGLATVVLDGTARAASRLREALVPFLGEALSTDQWLHWGVPAANAALSLWDFDAWFQVSSRNVELARSSGALAPLVAALNVHRVVAIWCGDFEAASSLGLTEEAAKEMTGTRRASYGALILAAYQGQQETATPLIAATAKEATARGEGLGLQFADRATALLHNGLGHYAEALTAAQRAAEGNLGPFTAQALPDLVEAAARSGERELATTALLRLQSATDLAASDWAAGLEARSRALLCSGEDAEHWYAEAVARLSRTRLVPELARAHLVYGEWLRREGRRTDARVQLRTAHEIFMGLGAHGFGERARRELLATGEKVRKRDVSTLNDLTPQEAHIARLARDGRSNPEIGSELFISARTVEWHLRKVFGKLGISSRKELQFALPARGRAAATSSAMVDG
jgi:DNA-binding CsgD family transcriptional regulator